MIFLAAEFSPILPYFGQFLWTTVMFLLVWLVLGRTAFKPIQNALSKREGDIQSALDEAKKAREEMATLKSDHQALLAQAEADRSSILKEAKEAKETIIAEARTKANEEYKQMIENAKEDIQNQKMAAITDLKNQVGTMAIEISEKVLREKLDGKQEDYIGKLVKEIKLN
ncbi:MAG: F0F1 ATP synthase subunit B [Bacteroidota bacterium]